MMYCITHLPAHGQWDAALVGDDHGAHAGRGEQPDPFAMHEHEGVLAEDDLHVVARELPAGWVVGVR